MCFSNHAKGHGPCHGTVVWSSGCLCSLRSSLLTTWFWVALQKAKVCINELTGRNGHLVVAALTFLIGTEPHEALLAALLGAQAVLCWVRPVVHLTPALVFDAADGRCCVGRGCMRGPSRCSSPASTIGGLGVLEDTPLPIPLSISFRPTVREFVQPFQSAHATSLHNPVVTCSRNSLPLCRKLLFSVLNPVCYHED